MSRLASCFLLFAVASCGGASKGAADPNDPNVPVSGHICEKDDAGAGVCDGVESRVPAPVSTPLGACVRAMESSLAAKDWSQGVATCEVAGKLIADWISGNKDSADPAALLGARVAAAAAFDFAALGTESSGGRYTESHCKLVNETYNHVIGSGSPTAIPSKVGHYSAAVGECRKRF